MNLKRLGMGLRTMPRPQTKDVIWQHSSQDPSVTKLTDCIWPTRYLLRMTCLRCPRRSLIRLHHCWMAYHYIPLSLPLPLPLLLLLLLLLLLPRTLPLPLPRTQRETWNAKNHLATHPVVLLLKSVGRENCVPKGALVTMQRNPNTLPECHSTAHPWLQV